MSQFPVEQSTQVVRNVIRPTFVLKWPFASQIERASFPRVPRLAITTKFHSEERKRLLSPLLPKQKSSFPSFVDFVHRREGENEKGIFLDIPRGREELSNERGFGYQRRIRETLPSAERHEISLARRASRVLTTTRVRNRW